MGKAILIFVLGSITLFTIVNLNMSRNAGDTANSSFDMYKEVYAKNISNSVSLMLISQLGDSNTYRTASVQTINQVLLGSAAYRVIDTIIGTNTFIKIDVTGFYEGKRKRTEVIASIPNGGFMPPTVKAAISTNNPVSTLGTLVVDGRDHDMNGNVIPNSGTLGIWSTRPIAQGGASKVGGTIGADLAPSKPAAAGILAGNQVYPGGYPTTPDSVLGGTAKGFPPGTLKSIALSRYKGSQYTTNPASLRYPLKGVTYVELPSGSIWNSSNIEGSGILVIHNSNGDAVIKNENVGTFKGLIIADDIVHLHTTVLGAIIALTPSPSEGNCIGNGSGDALFSRKAIIDGIGQVVKANLYGFGKQRIIVHRWYE